MIQTGKSTQGFHRLETYQSCPQKFAFSELLGLRPLERKDELFLGTLVHVGLANRYAKILGREDAEDPIEAIRKEGGDSRTLIRKATELYNGYNNHYSTVTDFKPVAVEEEFAVSVGDNELFTQRIDLVVEHNGEIIFVDHKTYGFSRPNWQQRGQFIGQSVLGRVLVPEKYGKPFGGIAVNEICTSTSRPNKFSRQKVEIPKELIDDFIKEVERSYGEIKSLVGRDPFDYPRNYSACEGKYGKGCDYWPLCVKGKAAMDKYE